jgi:DNA-damage-inducible protein J
LISFSKNGCREFSRCFGKVGTFHWDRVFNALGINTTTAIAIFVNQAVRERRIPFDIAYPPDAVRDNVISQAKKAILSMQNDIAKNGLSDMTMEDIEAEISAARAENAHRL